MDLQLSGKRAFVSGSSSGLGAAIARELAGEGVSVVIHGRDRTRAEATAQDVAAKGVQQGCNALLVPGRCHPDWLRRFCHAHVRERAGI